MATLAELDRLIRGWRGSMHDNVASFADKRMYSASPRGIMVSAAMDGGRRVVQHYVDIANGVVCGGCTWREEVVSVCDVR